MSDSALQAATCGLSELAMATAELKRWLASMERLTLAQKADLTKALNVKAAETEVGHFAHSRLAQSAVCSHCASTQIVRNSNAMCRPRTVTRN